MSVTLTREELYDRVWTTPVEMLAGELGLSGRGLGKLYRCRAVLENRSDMRDDADPISTIGDADDGGVAAASRAGPAGTQRVPTPVCRLATSRLSSQVCHLPISATVLDQAG
jgi:hypothetical protein